MEAEHVPQELPPPTGAESPLELLEKAAKEDSTLLAPLLQRGQDAPSFTWLMGRNNSNLRSHLEHWYS